MLHEGILHKCIKQLLEKKKNVPLSDMAEDLECLCQIMRTVGRRLDSQKAKSWMDQYFVRVRAFINNLELSSRIRFMLQDVSDLRENDVRVNTMFIINKIKKVVFRFIIFFYKRKLSSFLPKLISYN